MILYKIYRPKGNEEYDSSMLPTIAPPPVQQAAFSDSSPRFNPFDNQTEITSEVVNNEIPYGKCYVFKVELLCTNPHFQHPK